MHNCKRIGITGPSGAGKSTLSDYLRRFGVPVIDTDALYHEILDSSETCRNELTEEFGSGILTDGKIDRRALGDIVFAEGNGEKLARLNEITHKYVIKATEAFFLECESRGFEFSGADVPLLFESGISDMCDLNVSVLASKDVRLSRIIKRDGISEERAQMRLEAQKDDSFYIKHSDIVLDNSRSSFDVEFMKLCARLGVNLYTVGEV